MKKSTVILSVAILAALLSGCRAVSVGIIGGSDGPTAVYVTKDSKKNLEYKRFNLKMLKIDDELYYDTEVTNDIEGRCGTFDGELEMCAEEFEIPQINNGCNFDGVKGWQTGNAENTVEVPAEGNIWQVFKKIDTNSDVLKYKYCCVIEGKLPNANDESRFLVLSSKKDITLDNVYYTLFGSSAQNGGDVYALPLN